MTYVQQLKDYEDAVMVKRLEELPPGEQARLMEVCGLYVLATWQHVGRYRDIETLSTNRKWRGSASSGMHGARHGKKRRRSRGSEWCILPTTPCYDISVLHVTHNYPPRDDPFHTSCSRVATAPMLTLCSIANSRWLCGCRNPLSSCSTPSPG